MCHSSEGIEIQSLVQVLGHIVNNALDALRIVIGVIHNTQRLAQPF